MAGRLDAAEHGYRTLLITAPRHAAATNNLGTILGGRGEYGAALACYATAAELDPHYGEAFHNFGLVLLQTARAADAVAPLAHAVHVEPDRVTWWCDLGVAHAQSGNLGAALSALDAALAREPRAARVHGSRAIMLHQLGRADEARLAAERAVALDASLVDPWVTLGIVHRETRDLAAARMALRRALEIEPGHPVAASHLVLVEVTEGALTAALARAHDLVERHPGDADAWNTLGVAQAEHGDRDAAAGSHCRAIEVRPTDAVARWNLAQHLLLDGDFARGLALFEFRKLLRVPGAPHRDFPVPEWDGAPLEGRTVLVHAEQGLGDFIHFVRYVPMLASRGAGRVLLECPANLRPLVAAMPGTGELVAAGDALPPFDLHVHLMGLPLRFGTTVETIPAAPFYMKAPDRPVAATVWALRGPRVGLAWQGNPQYQRDRQRSIPFAALAPLLDVPGVSFVSLQGGPAAQQVAEDPRVLSIGGDLADAAAAIAELDVLISVDSGLAHLAGALGTPVWLALSALADWRWMCDRTDTPWYPRTRLVRQARPGDWAPVVSALSRGVDALVRGAAVADAWPVESGDAQVANACSDTGG